MTEQASTQAQIAALDSALRDGDEAARLTALAGLGRPQAGSADSALGLELLLQAMGDDSFRVRKEAVRVSLTWPDAALLAERLVAALGEEDNVGRRNAALEGVVQLGAAAAEPLLAALASRPWYRKVLLDALGALRGAPEDRVGPALRAALSDEDPNVRAAAAEGVGALSAGAAVEALKGVVAQEPDLVVRLAALEGLNRHRVALPPERLRPLLEQTVFRPAVFTALGHSREVAALPLLLEGLLDGGRGAREAAMAALVQLHNDLPAPERERVEGGLRQISGLALHSMIRALLEAIPGARRDAATLLGWAGRAEFARPLLLALLDQQHPEVSEAAGQALLRLGAPAIKVLRDVLAAREGLDSSRRDFLHAFLGRHGLHEGAEKDPSRH